MATIMDLPHEVISIILCKESVSIKDIVSFALTCKEFNEIINDNVLWRKKFYQRWPLLREEYDELLWKENIDFREQVKAEEAATILVQWYYPLNHVSYMSVRTSLDNIAQKVLEYLINHYPAHPIFSISAEQFSFWKYNNIDDNHWHGLEARQILESLCKVLHNTSGFFGNFWKCLGFQVLKDKFCNWLPLGIIYISVARRLGMCCDLVSSPFHFLFWRRKFNTANFRDSVYFHFDDLRCDSSLTPGCRYDDSVINLTIVKPTILSILRNEFDDHKKMMAQINNYFDVFVSTDTEAIKTESTDRNE
nr:PREDICTED: F-box only protein 21-like isoform X4 [Linepithema humile]